MRPKTVSIRPIEPWWPTEREMLDRLEAKHSTAGASRRQGVLAERPCGKPPPELHTRGA